MKSFRELQDAIFNELHFDSDSHLYGSIIYYGPDDTLATKATVGIVDDKNNIIDFRRFYSEDIDARESCCVNQSIISFLKKYTLRKVLVSDKIVGCPHEEGIDYPYGEKCPLCPFWENVEKIIQR